MRKRKRLRRKEIRKRRIIVITALFSVTFLLASGYAAFSTNLNINAKGNLKEASRVIQSWGSEAATDFHNSQYKENIVSATFLDTNKVPTSVVESWDVSEDQKGGVKAWITVNQEDHTKYDLFIGARDGVIANENSSYLFYDFNTIKYIFFNRNYDTSNAKRMSYMFMRCTSLEELDLSDFDTSKVTTMYAMFYDCNKLEELDLSHFSTNNVTDMFAMFCNCSKLSSLIITNFNTGNVKNMRSMFQGCIELVQLDLSSFNTSSVTTTKLMFYGMSKLEKIYVTNSFTTTNVSDSERMFISCSHLVGGNGTIYDANHVDKEYARIDTPANPGYFTLKTS